MCRQIGRLCFREPSAKVEGLTVRKLTLSDMRYSGTLAFNDTELKVNLGVDLSKLEEVAVHNTSASRIELCSTEKGSFSSEDQIPCGNMVRLRTIDLRGNALTSLGDLGQLPAIQELRISGEWDGVIQSPTSPWIVDTYVWREIVFIIYERRKTEPRVPCEKQ